MLVSSGLTISIMFIAEGTEKLLLSNMNVINFGARLSKITFGVLFSVYVYVVAATVFRYCSDFMIR